MAKTKQEAWESFTEKHAELLMQPEAEPEPETSILTYCFGCGQKPIENQKYCISCRDAKTRDLERLEKENKNTHFYLFFMLMIGGMIILTLLYLKK